MFQQYKLSMLRRSRIYLHQLYMVPIYRGFTIAHSRVSTTISYPEPVRVYMMISRLSDLTIGVNHVGCGLSGESTGYDGELVQPVFGFAVGLQTRLA